MPRSLALLLALFIATPSPCADPTYWQDIRPILRKHCTVCHSKRNLEEVDVSGGLALDTYEATIKGAKKPVIDVGHSDHSSFVQLLIITDEDKRMPRSSMPLAKEKIDLLRKWIDTGAKEGTKPDESATTIAAAPATPSRTRKRDIRLTTSVVPPAGLFGKGNSSKLELSLPVGPLSSVAALAFSPDGGLLAVGGYGRVSIWSLTDAKPIKVLTNVLGAVNDLRFSPDGKILAVAGGQPSAKGDLRFYQVSDWKLLHVFGGHEDVVFSVAFRADGKQLASASFDKTVRIWNLPDQKLVKTLTGHSDFVYAVAYSPDGKWLVSASKDRTVKLIDAASGKSKFTFSGMDQDVMAVAVSPDGKNVVSSGFEAGIYWWNPQTGLRAKVQGGHGIAVHELCFSKDGKVLASAGADKTVRLWDGVTGASKTSLPVGSVTYAVALSPNGKLVASGSFDGFVRLWDVSSGRLLVSLLTLPPEADRFDWLAVTPEGFASGSPGLAALGRWRMGSQEVPFDAVWKVLQQPEALTKAIRGETLQSPEWK